MSGDRRGSRADAEGGQAVYAGMLRAAARGLYADEAAVELLLGHGYWVGRDDFARRFVHAAAGPGAAGERLASIDWEGAAGGLGSGGGLACSASEAVILQIAASLGVGVPVSLRRVMGGLDDVNIALVARAVLHANGTSGATVTVPARPAYPPGVRVAGASGGAPPRGLR